jgi:hypothetical protein
MHSHYLFIEQNCHLEVGNVFFLGYKQGVKGCILFDLITKETFISRNVTHHDHILPYHTTTTPTTPWQYHTVLETISPDTISPDTDPTNQHNTNPVHDTQHSTSPTLSHTPDSSSDTNQHLHLMTPHHLPLMITVYSPLITLLLILYPQGLQE